MIDMPMYIPIVIGLASFIMMAVAFFILARRRLQIIVKAKDESIPELLYGYLDGKRQFTGDIDKTKQNLVDIECLIENMYAHSFIIHEDEEELVEQLKPLYKELNSLKKRMNTFSVKNERITRIICQYEQIDESVKSHNEQFENEVIDSTKDFFDHVLKYPLDMQQRKAIITEENNCLVISSAGSGKTSSIVGKVKYLTQIKHIDPHKILLISYTNKAASELTERMDIKGLRGYTFHKLALDIISKERKEKPSICDNTDSQFVSIFHQLLGDEKFKKALLVYFIDYQSVDSALEERLELKREQLSTLKSGKIKALFPDMDGHPVYVRSEQEKKLCFVLTSLGVKFRYEESYEHPVLDEYHCQYRPDFSIHYEKDGKKGRVYLENFGIDEHGMVPMWFAEDKNMPYEECNKQYGDGITWKRETHEKFGTTLIETTSADFHYFDIVEKVKKLFDKEGVPYAQLSDEQLYDMVLPKNSKEEKVFVRQAVTFITLMKTNCKSFSEIKDLAQKEGDERSLFILDNILQPVYEKYVEYMEKSQLKDFTDIILEATEICEGWEQTPYEYIIVDEFQDISMDRCRFLQALRKGSPKAKLFCVGDDWQSIYRFSGSNLSLFTDFESYFGYTDKKKIETTYRFGNPLVGFSSGFIQRNPIQIKKNISPYNPACQTDMLFYEYDKYNYASTINSIVASVPSDKSIYLLGRYSFDDYYLSYAFKSVKRGNKFFYIINGREIEFLTVHKSKGLEADYVILLQCNKDTFGFPALMSDDPVLNLILDKGDKFPYGEERRLFYVAITRAKRRTFIMYHKSVPSVFVTEFLHPERLQVNYSPHKNANKRWGKRGDAYLMKLYTEGKSIKQISQLMGRSQTSIIMRLQKLGAKC